MAVSEVLMKPGSWSLRLVESTPKSVLNALDWNQTATAGFGHIFIFKSPVKTTQFTDANLRSLAHYAGILRERPDARTFGGPGMTAWLGDEDDKGDILETAVTQSAATLQTWVNALRPAALSAGTSLNSGSYTGTFQWITRRKALDAVCNALGYEYRVNHNATLDANTVATLYGSTPTGFVSRRSEERGVYTGLLADTIEVGADLNDYTTKVRTIAKTGLGTATGAATAYKDINGNDVVITRVIETPEAEDANAIATLFVNRFSTQRKSLVMSTSTYAIHGNVKVGESVYVYDPRSGLVDTANQVHFGGQLTFPVSLRIYGMSWPIREGMGVAFRNGAGTWTDLTDWVQWETGQTTLDVGGYQRTLNGDPAYTSTADIMPAVDQGRWVAYAPTVDQGASTNIANTVAYARYRRTGSTVTVSVRLAFSGTGSAGSAILADLPISCAHTADSILVGSGLYHDNDGSQYRATAFTATSGTQIALLRDDVTGTGNIGADPNIAVAADDILMFNATYEAAVS